MKNKIIIFLIVVLVLALLGGILFTLKQDNTDANNDIHNENNINISDKNKENEDFSVDLLEESDHYVLTVKTNIIDEKFNFKYDNKNFMLDTSSSLFDDVEFAEEDDFRKVNLDLESNKLYKFYFIKKADAKLKLGNNLIVND